MGSIEVHYFDPLSFPSDSLQADRQADGKSIFSSKQRFYAKL